ncbi:L-idonate 5-dehydrogenase [Halomonas korlensis]|uniref:(R,R)-butanediol dehydrogenase / meso-butanediol dehydrogenase / diacetyl reductase n=1 Tax=Halomonas korlensis TaxID=463301 RepID=A0A1I7KJP4_9GAMM|nr:L-idonate 5-dehydrogenase [Halomonas korlensis]SFU97524.1 (R,R)-butanediol dehydrogenase / meso-butanediol dehydrogenase / diacetyl reductase [Halomonas korlensis]
MVRAIYTPFSHLLPKYSGVDMKSYVIYGPKDLRIEERQERELEADEVRLGLAYGGICGSDMHYYQEGKVGHSVVKEPMVLGHELTGVALEIGQNVNDVSVGDKVAISPALPCGTCDMCLQGDENVCFNMKYLGSAAKRPHTQGAFEERPVVKSRQCVVIPVDADLKLAALAEPYAISLHAVNLGEVASKRVLVFGAGTIGTLAAVAALSEGASEVYVADIQQAALERARELADIQAINANDLQSQISSGELPYFDVVIEASGAPQAFNTALAVLIPKGRLIQVGFLAPAELDMNMVLTKEITIRGAYRFLNEFDKAVTSVLANPKLASAVSATYEFGVAEEAFDASLDKQKHLKVMLCNNEYNS